MEKQFKKVGTHNGKFHADEVMSTALLGELFDLEVVRTRDPEVLKELELIYDVGEGEFDHHQLDKRHRENGIPYAACGLIWNCFGRDIIQRHDPEISPEDLEYLFHEIDAILIEGIDAADNGIRTSKTFIPTLNLSAIVSKFNPSWDSETEEDEAFHEAVRLASVVFRNTLKQKFSVVRARVHIQEAYSIRSIPQVLVLDKTYPWSDLLYEIDRDRELLYVVYPDHNQYMIQMARRFNAKDGTVKPMPASWAGKRDGELADITGVEDAVFCHTDRFIAGAGSLEGVLKMAQLAIMEPDEAQEEKQRRFLQALKRFLLYKRIRISILR